MKCKLKPHKKKILKKNQYCYTDRPEKTHTHPFTLILIHSQGLETEINISILKLVVCMIRVMFLLYILLWYDTLPRERGYFLFSYGDKT